MTAVPDVRQATPEEARRLTDRIRVAVDGTWQLIQDAYLTRTWAALGYASWDDYCTREFGTSRLRLPREERQEVVASLREIGMSTRAIASATGVHQSTISRGLSGDANASPAPELSDAPAPEPATEPAPDDEQATVTGTDGKQYRVKSGSTGRRATTSTPGASRPRPPLPTQFRTTANELSRLIARLERLRDDDRFASNTSAISTQCGPEVRRAAQVLTDLLSDLD